MKIALLICGTLRNYKDNYQGWYDHLLSKHNIDIFFHTYDIWGFHDDCDRKCLDTKDINDVVNLLKPKMYKIDSHIMKMNMFVDNVKTQCLRRGSPKPENIKAQLYSICIVNELKKEWEMRYGEYDIVMKMRFDTVLFDDFKISDINLIMSKNDVILCGSEKMTTMLYKRACMLCVKKKENCGSHMPVSDIIVIGNSNNMNVYANIYHVYDDYVRKCCIRELEKWGSLDKYVKNVYKNGAKMYYDIPGSECMYPEKVLALHLKDFVLLEYDMSVGINRNSCVQ